MPSLVYTGKQSREGRLLREWRKAKHRRQAMRIRELPSGALCRTHPLGICGLKERSGRSLEPSFLDEVYQRGTASGLSRPMPASDKEHSVSENIAQGTRIGNAT
jgi:hypothetical protein